MRHLKPTLLTLTLFSFIISQAQFKLPVNSSLRNDMQKVVADYPKQFANLRGEILDENPQSVEYASLIKVEKAERCTITRYSSGSKPVYSWQAVLLSTEDFEEAAKKYKLVFNQLKGMNIKYVVDQYTMRGSLEEPEESRKFATSVLAVVNPPQALKKLRMEVSMQFEFPEWKVSVGVFEKEREDDETSIEMED